MAPGSKRPSTVRLLRMRFTSASSAARRGAQASRGQARREKGRLLGAQAALAEALPNPPRVLLLGVVRAAAAAAAKRPR